MVGKSARLSRGIAFFIASLIFGQAVLLGDVDIRRLYTFSPNSVPLAPMVLGPDGSFYGSASSDNTDFLDSGGFVYRISRSGDFSILHMFDRSDPENRQFDPTGTVIRGRVVVDAAGNIYGATLEGGNFGGGTLFSLTPTGVYSVLWHFQKEQLRGRRIQFRTENGDFYLIGTQEDGREVIARLSADGEISELVSFKQPKDSGSISGIVDPFWLTSAIMGTDGLVYGTTSHGGFRDPERPGASYGTVFRIEADGQLTILARGSRSCANFSSIQEVEPGVFLCLALGQIVLPPEGGGALRVTASGETTLLKTFGTWEEGIRPASIVVGADGNYYGATSAGGVPEDGSVGNGTYFKLTPTGEYTVLESFGSAFYPALSLIEDGGDGFLYGVTTLSPSAAASLSRVATARAPAPKRERNRFFRFKVAEPPGGNLPPAAKADKLVLRAPKKSKTATATRSISASAGPLSLAILANDRDPEKDKLTISSVSVPQYGTATISADGRKILYTRGENFATDSFTYTVTDARGGTATTQVLLRRHAAGTYTTRLSVPADGGTVGSIRVTMNAFGTFNAWLNLGNKRVRFRGELDLQDSFRGSVQLPSGETAHVEFKLDSVGAKVLAGSVTQADTVMTFRAK